MDYLEETKHIRGKLKVFVQDEWNYDNYIFPKDVGWKAYIYDARDGSILWSDDDAGYYMSLSSTVDELTRMVEAFRVGSWWQLKPGYSHVNWSVA